MFRAATAPNIAKRKMPLGQEWATAAVIALVRERVALHQSRGVVKQLTDPGERSRVKRPNDASASTPAA